MKRIEFEHVVRAAGAILASDEILVIGSQALHGSLDKLPPEAERSIEVDVAVIGDLDGTRADLIDASIGEASSFHETFGYYAQGVVETTAILPEGWRERLVRFESSGTGGVVACCLEPHDLWIAKAIAGRPKDLEFCGALLRLGLVGGKLLRRRLGQVPDLTSDVREAILGRISG